MGLRFYAKRFLGRLDESHAGNEPLLRIQFDDLYLETSKRRSETVS
jgi:hypothetical protein